MHADLGSMPYSPLIALMTADYLLTARDLPGWPGITPVIDFRDVIVKGLAELRDGLFAADRIARELRILHGIARHHGLGEFFQKQVRAARRNQRKPLEGNAISPSRLYLDADQLGVRNIFDASYFAYFAQSVSAMASASTAWDALANSVRYRLLALKRAEGFPDETVWMDVAPKRGV
jgi:hypothetical protein